MVARLALGEDDRDTLLRGRPQAGNRLGGVLQVAVHHHDMLASTLAQTRRDRELLAEVA